MRGRSVRKTELAGGGRAARLTRCAGTWLDQEPDAAEVAKIDAAGRQLREQRKLSIEFHKDPQAANAFCVELFRTAEFAPLHFADELVEKMIANVGEPPVVGEGEETQFSDYLREAVLSVALPDTRRFLAIQLRRLLPRYVDAGQWREAIAIDYSAFRTSLGNEVTPFLAQMALAGMADYYDQIDNE
jgi:hypothetical protein